MTVARWMADIVAGRLTASIAQAVGPTGKVYAVETAEVVKAHPEIMGMMKGLATQMPNVVVSDDPVNSPLATGDIVTTGTLTRAFPILPGESWSTRLHGIELGGRPVWFA